MIKQGNRNFDILDVVRELGAATCAQIVAELEVGSRKAIDSAAISSNLFRLVQMGYLEYSQHVGPKGGHVYILGNKKQSRRLVLKLKLNATSNN